MDDLRMIRELLGDAPTPSPETMARARLALLEQARAEAVGQADTASAPDRRRRYAALGRRRRYVAALGRTRQVGRASRPQSRWWSWSLGGLGISGAVAAALVVPAILGPTAAVPGGPDQSGVASAPAGVAIGDGDDAGVVLRLAAANARHAPAVEIRPDQFIYRVGEERYLHVIGDVEGDGPVARIWVARRHENWYSPQGLTSARLRITEDASRTPLTPADAEAARKLGYDLTPSPRVEEHGPASGYEPPTGCTACGVTRDPGEWYQPTPEYLASLPTDPARLLAKVRQDVGDQNKHSADQEVFTAILDLLRVAAPIVPPEVRAALYQAVALIPGVERIDGRVELGGRQGVAIGRVNDPTADDTVREELVFDISGRELLGFRTVKVRATKEYPAGTVVAQDVPTFKVVDHPGEVR
jgi:hypothetical protein